MPTYAFKDSATGEEFEIVMRISELDAYKEANPTHKQQITGFPSMISMHGSTLSKAGHEWQDHLKRIKKSSGRNNTIKV